MNLASPNGGSSVEWIDSAVAVRKQRPLTWHKVTIENEQSNALGAFDCIL